MMVRGLVTLVAASVMVVALGVVAGVPPGSNEAGDVITDQTTATAAQARPRLTLATFNILGHSHTEPGGQYAAMASGTVRRSPRHPAPEPVRHRCGGPAGGPPATV
jgi:hypothetical protein